MKELKKTKPAKSEKHGRKKQQKRIELKRKQLKVLIKYIEKDYADIKNRYDALLVLPTSPRSHSLLTLTAASTPCWRTD